MGLMVFVATLPAQQTTLDWKLHDVGRVRQVVTNTGAWNAKLDPDFDYRRLINCEFPPGSFEEHLTEGGIWIGAIVNGDTFVSVTEGEVADREFYPSDAPWDTVWVVGRNDTVDIPYWPGYVGLSDQDFVCRYTDFGPPSLTRPANHRPLYLEVIQTSHAWSSPPLDEFLIFRYYLIPTRMNLEQVYLTSWINGNVGNARFEDFGLDDETSFRRERLLQICTDLPGGPDGTAYSPVATRLYPPDSSNLPLRYTFIWYNGRQTGLPFQDQVRYQQMASGQIMTDQQSTGDGTKSMVSVGPYSVAVGETLQFTIALVLGKGVEGVLENARLVDKLFEQQFRVPSPPPPPPLRIEPGNRRVTLRWDPLPGRPDPETYFDPYRADQDPRPFEGYRVYKSTISSEGPWTLLAEFDVPGNEYGANTGLAYQYTDVGLLNNFQYYYAVTAFARPDTVLRFPALESSIQATVREVVPGTPPPATVGQVAVVPNPYRGDIAYHQYDPPWERPDGSRPYWLEQDRRIQFIHLPAHCEIRIYTLAGDLVRRLEHHDPSRGYLDWDLTSSVGQAVASGLYLFTVQDLKTGQVQVGKFVIIK